MLKRSAKGLLARLLSYTLFALGFWLLFRGFNLPHVGLAVLGGVMVLVGMYLMVKSRRAPSTTAGVGRASRKEDKPGDLLHGGDKGDKLPP